jgi:hypothetical protein
MVELKFPDGQFRHQTVVAVGRAKKVKPFFPESGLQGYYFR